MILESASFFVVPFNRARLPRKSMKRRVWTFSPTDNRFHTHEALSDINMKKRKKKHRTLLTDTFAINNNILMVRRRRHLVVFRGVGEREN